MTESTEKCIAKVDTNLQWLKEMDVETLGKRIIYFTKDNGRLNVLNAIVSQMRLVDGRFVNAEDADVESVIYI